MRYSAAPALDAAYRLIAVLYEREDQPEQAMTIADALIELGEDRSWASVWWAYGAVHHDLSDSGYERALGLLAGVDGSPGARAAALMLRAEIESTRAIEQGISPDVRRQAELLSEAVDLAPDWPNLRIRLTRACLSVGDKQAARQHAQATLAHLEQQPTSGDPFDSALSGRTLDRTSAAEELDALGVLNGALSP